MSEPSDEMPKQYSPTESESRWYEFWETSGYFAASEDPDDRRPTYTLAIPPPNVTGSLHMGHACRTTFEDVLCRHKRMQGYNTLWVPGIDHAGIATQVVVERQLKKEGLTRHDLGREKFIERVWEWKEESGGRILEQLRKMGASCDWPRTKFTMDPDMVRAVREAFVRLHEEGLIYRDTRLVNWDVESQTVLSDLEVEQEENVEGVMFDFAYPLADGDGEVVVSTTRPETMLGDTAVAIHPDDERYRHLHGKYVRHPFVDRMIPVILDAELVDPEFGTGVVKVTPAHDPNDFATGKRHGLEEINIFELNGTLNENGGPFQGLERFAARKAVENEISNLGLARGSKKHMMTLPRSQRSGSIVEPMISTQWFVKMKPLAEPAIKAVEDGTIQILPPEWTKTYFHWLRNIQDWCISRQLWWGHPIPAWYCDDCEHVTVSREDARACGGCGGTSIRQDDDVLDTWFSSGLWPFSTLGWPESTPELKTFYPTSVLVTGFDIIFFWVARMIMMGLKFIGDVPFREVYIHGLIRDQDGQKMSKSKGNVLDPLDLIDGTDLESLVAKRTTGLMQPQMKPKIEKATRKHFPDGIPEFGTDALRFTFGALASNGRDVRFDLQRIEGYRNFCNKLWNAARYVLLNVEGKPLADNADATLSLPDRWIRSRLGRTIQEVSEQFANYRLDLATKALYEFTWNEYCDWYLELSKPILTDTGNEAEQAATRSTLTAVLEALLRCLHPIVPFITEEIWQRVAPFAGKVTDESSIMLQPYPEPADFPVDEAAEAELDWIRQFVLGIRQIRGEMDIAPGKPLSVFLQDTNDEDVRLLGVHERYLTKLARLEEIAVLPAGEDPPPSATALLGRMKIFVPMAGLIDVAAERARLTKNRDRVSNGLKRVEGKLANEKFCTNAPAAVIAKEQQKCADMQQEISQIDEQLARLDALS